MSGRMKVLLVVSLILNLFVVGAIAGVALGGLHAGRHGMLAHAADGLSPPARSGYLLMLGDRLQDARPLLQDARLERQDAGRRLAAQPFDRTAAGAAMARARDDEVKARTLLDDAILDYAAKLSPQDRAVLAQGMRTGGPLRWGGRRPWMAHMMGPPPGSPPGPPPE